MKISIGNDHAGTGYKLKYFLFGKKDTPLLTTEPIAKQVWITLILASRH